MAGLAYRLCGDRELAEEVVQETFLYLLDRLPDVVLTARFTTYLYPVVRFRTLEARRRQRRHPEGTGEDPPEEASSPDPERRRDTQEALELALAKLGDKHREPLLLRYVDGWSVAEIAGALEVPEGTVKSRLFHGLRALREDPVLKRAFFPPEKSDSD